MNLRISEAHYQEMRKITSLSFLEGIKYPPETGCILLLAKNSHPVNPALIVNRVLAPEKGDFAEQGSNQLVFASTFLRRALLEVRQQNLAGFLTVHTHPFSNTHVGFSFYDDDNDPSLMANLYDLQPEGVFGSIVLGKQTIAGRIWLPSETAPTQIGELIVVGEQLRWIPLDGTPPPAPPEPLAIFDRSLAITGGGALAQAAKMRIGIIGASGTGSLMAELLVRAGVGEVVIFEFDTMDSTNLNRVLYSRRRDAANKVSKAARLAEAIGELEMPTRVTIIDGGNITEEEVARELRGCDFLFGCVDNRDWPRLVLTEVAYQYLIPFIDLGTEIGPSVQSLDARVSYLAPDRPCLICSGIVSNERVYLEGLAPEERERVVAMGYSKERPLHAPAVMDLNMRAASTAMMVLRHLLQPFLDVPLPTHIKEAVTNFNIRKVVVHTNPQCTICGADGRTGVGDAMRFTTFKGGG